MNKSQVYLKPSKCGLGLGGPSYLIELVIVRNGLPYGVLLIPIQRADRLGPDKSYLCVSGFG